MVKALEMSSKTLILSFLAIIWFNHALLSNGSRDILEGKVYQKRLPIKAITLHDGDVYDCLKFDPNDESIRRKIQLRENNSPQGTRKSNSSHESTSHKLRPSRVVDDESCPAGSFPVLKATRAGPLNFSAIEDFATLRARYFNKTKSIKPLATNHEDGHTSSSNREYAQASVQGSYKGAKGTFSVWQPRLENNEEMSVSQVWVIRETDHIQMTLEAGWMVNPSLYGDTRTRWFIFTTNDDYQTWLYNDNRRNPSGGHLQFTRVDNYFSFGQRLECSVPDGEMAEIEIIIRQDNDDDWELLVDDVLIGYWPKSNYGEGTANKVTWGGEVLNLRRRGRHTNTEMGNGHFADEPLGNVAYISNMGLYDHNKELYDAPTAVHVDVDEPDCYNLRYWSGDEDFGQHITFGGPGYDRVKCP